MISDTSFCPTVVAYRDGQEHSVIIVQEHHQDVVSAIR